MKYQLRHFDYVLPVGTLSAGQQMLVNLHLENDSSFMLRGRAVHISSTNDIVHPFRPRLLGQAALVDYFDQYTGPDGEYLSQTLTRFSNENETFGQYGSPLPVRPPLIYPPGGSIQANILNNSEDTDLIGLEIYFRGSKLFAPGVLPCLTYPEKFSTNWQIYAGPRPGFPALTLARRSSLLNNILQNQSDSDFALRSIHVGSMEPADGDGQYGQVWITLKDFDGRAYSNLPVHVDVAFGALGSLPFGGGSAGALSTDVGPYHPGLLTPEIYIPASRIMYYDLVRDDTFTGGPSDDVTLKLAFQGAKVYPL